MMDLFSYNSVESAYMCAYLSLPFLSSSAQHTLGLLCTFKIPSPPFDKAKLVRYSQNALFVAQKFLSAFAR